MSIPGYKLHLLEGTLAEHWSVWVNGNWRVTFRFTEAGAELVDYQGYHQEPIMMRNPPHPGEILREDVIVPLGLSVTEAADRLAMGRVHVARRVRVRPHRVLTSWVCFS